MQWFQLSHKSLYCDAIKLVIIYIIEYILTVAFMLNLHILTPFLNTKMFTVTLTIVQFWKKVENHIMMLVFNMHININIIGLNWCLYPPLFLCMIPVTLVSKFSGSQRNMIQFLSRSIFMNKNTRILCDKWESHDVLTGKRSNYQRHNTEWHFCTWIPAMIRQSGQRYQCSSKLCINDDLWNNVIGSSEMCTVRD